MKFTVLDKFKCIAQDCPDDCCHRWRIDVDASTRATWLQLPASDMRDKMLATLEQEGGDYYLPKRADGYCHFFIEGLCEIQTQLGHDLLPHTCQQYPRVAVGVASNPVQSAYLSCPEIVRLLLEMSADTDVFSSDGKSKTITRFDSRYAEKLLDRFIKNLLSNSETTAGEVLYHAGRVLVGLLSRGTFEKTLKELEKYYSDNKTVEGLLNSTRKAQRNRQLKLVHERAAQFWLAVISLCRVCREPGYGEARLSLEINDPHQKYLQVMRLWRDSEKIEDFLQDGIKRYLEVKLVNHGFPLAVNQNQLLNTFLECVIATAQIIYLIKLKSREETLSFSELETIIYKVERSMVHNDAIEDVLGKHPELQFVDDYLALFLD